MRETKKKGSENICGIVVNRPVNTNTMRMTVGNKIGGEKKALQYSKKKELANRKTTDSRMAKFVNVLSNATAPCFVSSIAFIEYKFVYISDLFAPSKKCFVFLFRWLLFIRYKRYAHINIFGLNFLLSESLTNASC